MSRFDTWLAALRLAKKGGVYLSEAPASRGRPWSLALAFPGDYSAATLTAQLRHEPDAADPPLAVMTVEVGSFDAGAGEAGETVVTLSLASGTGADSTGALPADGDHDGIAEFPFDIVMSFEGETDLLMGGVLPVIGRITP